MAAVQTLFSLLSYCIAKVNVYFAAIYSVCMDFFLYGSFWTFTKWNICIEWVFFFTRKVFERKFSPYLSLSTFIYSWTFNSEWEMNEGKPKEKKTLNKLLTVKKNNNLNYQSRNLYFLIGIFGAIAFCYDSLFLVREDRNDLRFLGWRCYFSLPLLLLMLLMWLSGFFKPSDSRLTGEKMKQVNGIPKSMHAYKHIASKTALNSEKWKLNERGGIAYVYTNEWDSIIQTRQHK